MEESLGIRVGGWRWTCCCSTVSTWYDFFTDILHAWYENTAQKSVGLMIDAVDILFCCWAVGEQPALNFVVTDVPLSID